MWEENIHINMSFMFHISRMINATLSSNLKHVYLICIFYFNQLSIPSENLTIYQALLIFLVSPQVEAKQLYQLIKKTQQNKTKNLFCHLVGTYYGVQFKTMNSHDFQEASYIFSLSFNVALKFC